MLSRLVPVEGCVRLWAAVIDHHPAIVWEIKNEKPVDPTVLQGILLAGINTALREKHRGELTLEDISDTKFTRIAINADIFQVLYVVLFEIPNMGDRTAAAVGGDGRKFPEIMTRGSLRSGDGVVQFICNLYPILDDSGETTPSHYRLDLIENVRHNTVEGQQYIATFLYRNRIELRVSEFIRDSEQSERYKLLEERANVVLKGEVKVACAVCGSLTSKTCGSCLTPYCRVECQKKDWLKGHRETCK